MSASEMNPFDELSHSSHPLTAPFRRSCPLGALKDRIGWQHHAPQQCDFATIDELMRLSRTSIADEMRTRSTAGGFWENRKAARGRIDRAAEVSSGPSH